MSEQKLEEMQLLHKVTLEKLDFINKNKLAVVQLRMGIVTTVLVNFLTWAIVATGSFFAIWGITVALDLILKAWGLK